MQNDIQRVNNSLSQQMNQLNTQQQQQLSSVNSSLKQQLDTQKQQLISANQAITSTNNVLSTTVSQVSNLQTQIDGTKSDVRTVQNQLTGINGLINNITNVNAVQSADINALKAQTGQNMDGSFWCIMLKNYLKTNKITGYCTNLKMCCINQANQSKTCLNGGTQTFSETECGTFVVV
ncbi:Hypothetical_protein [Hexamita inflata]|uniref:Hypothetical_protein n=1 Tax=Hexamita inflata TaxID=28002 RepID=A0AA86NAB2_9EUKA|nr:Hypothetical protein HINF_LOCUS3275 [Hexamita inflata]